MDLLSQYRMMHEAGKFPGFSILGHTEAIRALIKSTESKSLLDYGCGKGLQYSEAGLGKIFGSRPTLYDPAVSGLDKKPEGMFDGVICTDVLEHIPEEDLRETLREIFCYTREFVFFSICTRAAKKILPDGRNCHLTIKPREWWHDLIWRAAEHVNLNPDLNPDLSSRLFIEIEWTK